MVSPRAPQRPTDRDESLGTLVAARRAAKLLSGAVARRRGGVAAALSTEAFPNQPAHSVFLSHLSQNVSSTPLQLVLDVGSKEEDAALTMSALLQHVRNYLAKCAVSVERQAERVQAVLGQLTNVTSAGEQDAAVCVAERVRRRLGSITDATMLSSVGQRHVKQTRRPSSATEDAVPANELPTDPERPPAELLYQVAFELQALTPRRLPDFVLCYWDFTLGENLESELRQAFEPLGAAIKLSRVLIQDTNKYFRHAALDEADAMNPFNATCKEIPIPPSCCVTWKLQYCRLRGVSFVELPMSFSPFTLSVGTQMAVGGQQQPSSLGGGARQSSKHPPSPRNNGSGEAVTQIQCGDESAYDTSFQLASLSVSHCIWRESSKYGLQHVLRNSGWSLTELELRGAQVAEELIQAVSTTILRPSAMLSRVVWANCKGWSTTDPTVQLKLVEGLRGSQCVRDLVLQGVPLPPKAGIALLDALQHNPVIDQVRLESCHFVTPKYLAMLHSVLQSTDRRTRTASPRKGAGSVSESSTRRTSMAGLLA